MSDVENFEEIQKCYELLDQNHIRLMDMGLDGFIPLFDTIETILKD